MESFVVFDECHRLVLYLTFCSTRLKLFFGPWVQFPPCTPCWEFPPNTEAHLFLNKIFHYSGIHIIFSYDNTRILCECKYLEDCLHNCFDTSGKKYHNFVIYLSEIAEIHAWNEVKWYKFTPISTQIFSVIQSNEQLSTDSQYHR